MTSGKRTNVVMAVLLATVVMAGCAKPKPASPAVVTALNIEKASEAVDTVSIGLVAANATLKSLHASGAIEEEYYVSTRAWIVRITTATKRAVDIIEVAKAGDTTADWKAAVLAISDAASSADPLTFGIKNPDSRAKLKAGLATLKAAVQLITAVFGGK